MQSLDQLPDPLKAIDKVTQSVAAAALNHYLKLATFSEPRVARLWKRSPSPPQLSNGDLGLVTIHEPCRPVGGGHFCDLYLGVRQQDNLVLAMKRPKFPLYDREAKEKAEKNFRREEKAWESLEHLNILPFFGRAEISNDIYLVSPWIAYGDLWGFLTARLKYLRHPHNERNNHPGHDVYTRYRELKTVLGIASGLAYLHSQNVIHGDIKALNVLLDDNLNPLLCDFGLTRILDWDYNASSSVFLNGAGSWRWLAPELMRENGLRKTHESDMYAFGITVSEVLTGKTPFSGCIVPQLANPVIEGVRPAPLPDQREGQDFNLLWKVAADCWVADYSKRPSAEDVVHTLTRAGRNSWLGQAELVPIPITP